MGENKMGAKLTFSMDQFKKLVAVVSPQEIAEEIAKNIDFKMKYGCLIEESKGIVTNVKDNVVHGQSTEERKAKEQKNGGERE